MGFGNSSLFLKITFVLLVVAFVIQLLALAIPYWFSADNSGVCVHFSGWWEATQAFEVIGILLIIAALILVIVVIFVKDMKVLKLIAFILSFCACGCILLGVIIWGAEAFYPYDEYSGSFALAIICSIVMLVAGILGLLDWMGKGK
ncbi:uncharacterized protein LOC128235650 [Mya arenaria]|uniref:uncharacterized protein LOC128235650 n=1 Tax=Mya arenaria TaxID=6604 RepID=UPI0022E79DD4|nr:uncharacterized protein LOC128235650 [Mya arenaria]